MVNSLSLAQIERCDIFRDIISAQNAKSLAARYSIELRSILRLAGV